MRTRTWIVTVTLLAAGFCAGKLVSQEEQPSPEMMQQMMELARPGEEHELLKSLEGEWDQTYEMHMAPGAPATKAQGTSVNRMILGGRFLEQRVSGTMGPMKVESLSLMGFDRRHGVFTSVGFDTMGTYYVTAKGKRNPDTGLIVMAGEDDDPMGKQVYRYEVEIKSADEFVTSIIFTQLGPMKFEDGFKMLQVTSKRKQ